MQKFMTLQANFAELLTHMPPTEYAEYISYGHQRIEAAYHNCVYVVYQPRGRQTWAKDVIDQKEPKVITTIRVVGFKVDLKDAQIQLRDEATGQEMYVRHTPKKLFHYPIYVAIPTDMTLKLTGRARDGAPTHRDMSFAMLVKTRNRSDFYSTSNTYMETPNNFKTLYPAIAGGFTY